jgi:hypothetical protein
MSAGTGTGAAGSDERLDEFFTALSDRLGTVALGRAEIDVVLDLARVVAHLEERRYAPLTAYLAGLGLADSADVDDPDARADHIRGVIGVVRDLAGSLDPGGGNSGPA